MILLVALAAALLGRGFTFAYAFSVATFRRERGMVFPKLVVGMALSVTLVWLVNPALFGPALAVIEGTVTGAHDALCGVLPPSVPVVIAPFVVFVVRIVASCLTIGSGMSAGIGELRRPGGRWIRGHDGQRTYGNPFDSGDGYEEGAAVRETTSLWKRREYHGEPVSAGLFVRGNRGIT